MFQHLNMYLCNVAYRQLDTLRNISATKVKINTALTVSAVLEKLCNNVRALTQTPLENASDWLLSGNYAQMHYHDESLHGTVYRTNYYI